MNKLIEYINGLDRKNLIYLYLSILIVGIMVYYNVNYSIFQKKINLNESKIRHLREKLISNKRLEKEILEKKALLKKLLKENLSLKEDFRYVNLLIQTSNKLKINDKKFLNVLESILDSASKYYVTPSYTIGKDTNKTFVIYDVKINGKCDSSDFLNLYKYIVSVEKINVIKNFTYSDIFLDSNNTLNYKMNLKIWGIK